MECGAWSFPAPIQYVSIFCFVCCCKYKCFWFVLNVRLTFSRERKTFVFFNGLWIKFPWQTLWCFRRFFFLYLLSRLILIYGWFWDIKLHKIRNSLVVNNLVWFLTNVKDPRKMKSFRIVAIVVLVKINPWPANCS